MFKTRISKNASLERNLYTPEKNRSNLNVYIYRY